MSVVTADYYYPDWGCHVDFSCTTTLDLSSQSGAYDISATLTNDNIKIEHETKHHCVIKNVGWTVLRIVGNTKTNF